MTKESLPPDEQWRDHGRLNDLELKVTTIEDGHNELVGGVEELGASIKRHVTDPEVGLVRVVGDMRTELKQYRDERVERKKLMRRVLLLMLGSFLTTVGSLVVAGLVLLKS